MVTDADWVGSMPATYDRCLGGALFAPFAALVSQHAAALGPRRVLELAAGTGIATAELCRCLPDAQILATDLNPAMVAWGQEHVPDAQWQQADAQNLDIADGSVDLVVCQFGVMFFPDRRRAYTEAARVLRPGGTLLFTSWDVVEASPFPAALVECLSRLWPDDPPTFLARVPHGYTDVAQIRGDLDAAGLDDVDIERVVLSGQAPSARVLAEGFCSGTPLRFDLEQRGDLDALSDAIGAEMTSILGAGPVTGDLTANLTRARPRRI